jgi:hypothetical protein
LEEVRSYDTGSIGDSNHPTSTNGCTGRSYDCRCSVGDKGDDGCVGTCDHEDSDVAAADARYCRKEDVADGNENQGSNDVLSHESPSPACGHPELTAGLSLFRSECQAFPMMTKKANAFGGTVSS